MPKKSPLLAIILTVFIDLLGVGIIIPILVPLFKDSVHGILPLATSDATRNVLIGLIGAMFPLAQFFGAPLLGTYSDKHGRKKILLICLIGTLIGYVMFALGVVYKNLFLLFASRILDGFTGGNISVAMSAISDVSKDAKSKAKNFGLVGMAFGLGFIIGPFIGGKLSDPRILSWFTFATPFWAAAILCFINILILLLNFPETLAEKNVDKQASLLTGFFNLKIAFTNPNIRTIFIVSFLTTFGFTFYTNMIQIFFYQKYQFGQSEIGSFFGYIGIWIAITQGLITRYLVTRYSSHNILSYSLIILSISILVQIFPEKSWYIYLIAPFIAISNGLTNPNLTAIVSGMANSKEQGEILGVGQSVTALAMFLAPIIGGQVVNLHYSLPIVVSSASILGAWLVLRSLKAPSTVSRV